MERGVAHGQQWDVRGVSWRRATSPPHTGHPPRLSPPVVPRPSHRETPEPQPYRSPVPPVQAAAQLRYALLRAAAGPSESEATIDGKVIAQSL
jgi:hypothetical protein